MGVNRFSGRLSLAMKYGGVEVISEPPCRIGKGSGLGPDCDWAWLADQQRAATAQVQKLPG